MYQIQSTFPLEGYLETRIGGRPENQDSCGFSDTPLGALVVVCDGMGGMNGGSTASSLAVQVIIETLSAAGPDDDPSEVIRKSVLSANSAIIKTGEEKPELKGMGTTMTLLLLRDDCAYIAYVGDSRVYQLRSGKKLFRTFDDSVVFQLVRSGALTEEEARVAGNSNIITKALGIGEELEFDVARVTYDKDDRFLLCSDGFWGPLPEPRLLGLLGKKDELSLTFERCLNKVEVAARESRPTHYDNLTAAVIDVKQYSKQRSKMEKKLKITTVCLAVLLLVSLGLLGMSVFHGNKVARAARCQTAAVKARQEADSLQKVCDQMVLLAERSRQAADQANDELHQAVMSDLKGDQKKDLEKAAREKGKTADRDEKMMKKTRAEAEKAQARAARLKKAANAAVGEAREQIQAVSALIELHGETQVDTTEQKN